MMVWNLIIDQTSYHSNELITESLEKLFVQYIEVYFSPDSRLDSFQGMDCLDDEIFEKIVAKRFKTMREIFGLRKESLLDPLMKLNSTLHNEANVAQTYASD
jgi:DNA-binding MltR family transcriptional regulator